MNPFFSTRSQQIITAVVDNMKLSSYTTLNTVRELQYTVIDEQLSNAIASNIIRTEEQYTTISNN